MSETTATTATTETPVASTIPAGKIKFEGKLYPLRDCITRSIVTGYHYRVVQMSDLKELTEFDSDHALNKREKSATAKKLGVSISDIAFLEHTHTDAYAMPLEYFTAHATVM